MSKIQDIPLSRIDGSYDTLGDHRGKVLLVVNTASKCGLTPQYEGLEALYQRFKDQGFEVLGFPANDFAGQEPGTDSEIADFCSVNYNVSFPMYAKGDVTGPAKQPLYAALTAEMPMKQGNADEWREKLRGHGLSPTEDPEVLWNFEKFLIGRDGNVAARFSPATPPEDISLVGAIEVELAKAG
jgi:glutathione peroxidase